MDRAITGRRLPSWWRWAVLALGVVVALLVFRLYAPQGTSQTLKADEITVSTVRRGQFDDFIPLRAQVAPLLTVYLDSIDGGRVEKVLIEDGSMVVAGQPIVLLSNAELQLSTLARQTEVEQQINNMRSQELALSQTRLANERLVLDATLALKKSRRQYESEAPLADRGFVSRSKFAETIDQYLSDKAQLSQVQRGQRNDERLQSSQLNQQRAAMASIQSGLAIARSNLDSLNLRAPLGGQLSGFDLQVGQSLSRGERIGQIDSPGKNKLQATIDEFYLGRAQLGRNARVDVGGRSYIARVTKIYPQVKSGQFRIDLQFTQHEPPNLQRGQTLQARLTLGDPVSALILANGAFYNDTGGAFVFVVAADGRSAVKRPVRLGRRSPEAIEVLDGLQPGDRVITSSNAGFVDKDRLDLTRD